MREPTMSQRGGSHLAPRFKLIGSQALRQQALNYANIYSPIRPQAEVSLLGDLEEPIGTSHPNLGTRQVVFFLSGRCLERMMSALPCVFNEKPATQTTARIID